MAGEVLSKWERFVTEPVFKRYVKYAKEPAALLESIGEDLASSNEEIREIAFWALVYAMPKLTSVLYEWETRQPGWREVEGKDQQMVNRGMDIVTYLHRKLVIEHRFKIGGEYGKDPRPYVNETIENKKKDEQRKRGREVLLDYDATLTIPDPARSLEESVIEKISLADPEKEFLALRFIRGDKERALFRTVLFDESSLDSVQEHLGISSKDDAVRQQFSRARKQAVADRDALFTFLLHTENFSRRGKLPRFPKNPEMSEWTDQLIRFVRPRAWLNGEAADGKNMIAVRPLTTGLRDAHGHVYLVAIHKGYAADLWMKHLKRMPDPYLFSFAGVYKPWFDLLTLDNQRFLKYVDKLIDTKSRDLQQSRYTYTPLDAYEDDYSTELPYLNVALAEIREDYYMWLISNSVPDTLRVHQWSYGVNARDIALPESRKLDGGHLLSKTRIWRMLSLIRPKKAYAPFWPF